MERLENHGRNAKTIFHPPVVCGWYSLTIVKKSSSAAVVNLIAFAAKKTGWSIAKLNRHLGKGENTLHRWSAGTMENFELAALIEMCRLAEISMDDAFGSHHKVSAQVDAGGQTAIDPELEQRVAKLEADNQAIKPLVQIVDGFAALIASHMAVAQSQVNNGPPEAASLKTTGIIDAIEQEHEATGGVLPRARDFEQDQAKEKA